MVLLGDDVGANLDITGDGHIGGYKLIMRKVVFHKEKKREDLKFSRLLGLKTYLVNLFVAF